MTKIRGLFLSAVLFLGLAINAPKAHALSDVAITTLATTAGLVISYIVAGGAASVVATSGGKEAAMAAIADDAAAFLMNDGQDASAFLSAIMQEIKETEEVKALNEEVTDMDIARIILLKTENI